MKEKRGLNKQPKKYKTIAGIFLMIGIITGIFGMLGVALIFFAISFILNLEKTIHKISVSFASIIIFSYILFNPNVTYIVSGEGFLGLIVIFPFFVYHLIKYLKERKKN